MLFLRDKDTEQQINIILTAQSDDKYDVLHSVG